MKLQGTRDYSIGEGAVVSVQAAAQTMGLEIRQDFKAPQIDFEKDIVKFDVVFVMDKYTAADILREVNVLTFPAKCWQGCILLAQHVPGATFTCYVSVEQPAQLLLIQVSSNTRRIAVLCHHLIAKMAHACPEVLTLTQCGLKNVLYVYPRSVVHVACKVVSDLFLFNIDNREQ